ncbi:hypothetical protein Save01_01927 [Streptomyces avermitilis]
MKQFDDPLFRSLADRALELIKDDTLGVTPPAT